MIYLEKYLADSDATEALGQLLGKHAKDGDVICLSGDLGAGKTLFVQNLAKALGVQGDVTSPTFNLMNIYKGRISIFHFDLYRLEQEYELEEIGFYDYVEEPEGLVLIEWAEKFMDCLPENYISLEIQRTEQEQQRILRFELVGQKLENVYKEMESLCQF